MEIGLINILMGSICPFPLFFEWDGLCDLILMFAVYVDVRYEEDLWGCIPF